MLESGQEFTLSNSLYSYSLRLSVGFVVLGILYIGSLFLSDSLEGLVQLRHVVLNGSGHLQCLVLDVPRQNRDTEYEMGSQ